MNIVKIFASILLLAGMALLIFACLAVMQIVELDTIKGGWIAPCVLGLIFFVGGLSLFKYLLPKR